MQQCFHSPRKIIIVTTLVLLGLYRNRNVKILDSIAPLLRHFKLPSAKKMFKIAFQF